MPDTPATSPKHCNFVAFIDDEPASRLMIGDHVTEEVSHLQASAGPNVEYASSIVEDPESFREQARSLLERDDVATVNMAVLSDGEMPKGGFFGTLNALSDLFQLPKANKLKKVNLMYHSTDVGNLDSSHRGIEPITRSDIESWCQAIPELDPTTASSGGISKDRKDFINGVIAVDKLTVLHKMSVQSRIGDYLSKVFDNEK